MEAATELKTINPENVKITQWEDYQQEVARLCSLSLALREANERTLALKQKLDLLIQVEAESLSRSNELEEMREKLERKKLAMGNTLVHSKVLEEDAKKQEEQLGTEVRSLLVGVAALSVARKQLQEGNWALAGEKGCLHLKRLQKMLRTRQQHMVSQVSYLYPVKLSIGSSDEQELESFPSGSRSGCCAASRSANQGILTISGVQLSMLPFKKISFFTDKKEVRRSATALGYIAHAVSLISSYLAVPLRFPLHLGGSHSYINDYAPSIEPNSSSDTMFSLNSRPIEFPLYLDGQDATRAAYAVFLLNKDIEQLLNFIGANSLGPRNVLGNLRELLQTILSPEYIVT